MSGFSLVSVFLTLLLNSFPATFSPLITELQKSIDGAKSQISSTGYAESLERYVKEIKRHLWWLRFVMLAFVAYFVFYLVIVIGYLPVAILTKSVLTHLFPVRYLGVIPENLLVGLVALHQSLLKLDVQPLDRVLLSAALVLSAVVFWWSPLKIYSRAKAVLKDAYAQIEFLRKRDAR
ncbi:hypothetical protein NLM16_16660 [Bradyrhizobium brasilense]|uniref:hypothetical protein n=1 Tax=Bradyrhizobium brasilense TaxID=1419277 RepID=UPI0028773893|nr:hypothetical protein [Bradyrhizobium brasilense]MCP3415732.1 hypothetical protein [Bradyrhizobium brasilense]